MMRYEHGQMRTLLDQLAAAANCARQRAYAGVAETLLMLMQQHNMKEETSFIRCAIRCWVAGGARCGRDRGVTGALACLSRL